MESPIYAVPELMKIGRVVGDPMSQHRKSHSLDEKVACSWKMKCSCCSLSTMSRKIITWPNFIYFILGSINIYLPIGTIQSKLPSTFKGTKY